MITNLSTRSSLFLFAVIICLTPLTSQASIIYVDVSASESLHDGTSWCSAFMDLQDALSVAVATDEIFIANGTYYPDQGTGNREASFHLISYVAIRGGYAGCGAANPNARNLVSFETILSGDLSNNDRSNFINYSENSYHVVAATNVNNTGLLDGVTITGGNADGPNFGPDPSSKDQGSGINNYWSTARYENCTVRKNYSANHGAFNDHGGATLINCTLEDNESGKWGGGMFVAPHTVATVTDCKFSNNHTGGSAGGGGGVVNGGNSVYTDCLFSGNVSDTKGGGLYNHSSAKPTFNGCTFLDNFAEFGGGLYNQTGSHLEFTNCQFTSNVAGQYGGGVWGYSNPLFFTDCSFTGNSTIAAYGGGLYFAGNNSILTRCTFSDNTSLQGAGLYLSFGTVTFESCTFIRNHATSSGHAGGGIFCSTNTNPILRDCLFSQNTAINGTGGGMYVFNDSVPILTRCTFVGNHARVAGGFYSASGGIAYLTNCKFIANSANASCGGAYFYLDTSTLVNCVFNGNSAVNSGGAIISAYSDTSIINCTMVNNSAGRGGGLFAQSIDNSFNGRGSVNILNSILWNNTDSDPVGTTQSSQIYPAFDAVPVVSYSCVKGWNGSLDGINNISEDPLLVYLKGSDNLSDTADDDVRLLFDSPALDRGNEEFLPADESDLDGDGNTTESVPYDLAGSERVYWDGVDMGASELADCNQNGIHDAIDFLNGLDQDCNNNIVLDLCELQSGRQQDCNTNNKLDVCDIADGFSIDINENQWLDICEADCNGNDLPDEYEITQGFVFDCNNNFIPDGCDIEKTAWLDCNENGFLDDCDIAEGISPDVDGNCIPDECLQRPRPAAELIPLDKSRYIAFTPTRAGCLSAIRVTLRSLYRPDVTLVDQPDFSTFENEVRWVGPPSTFSENAAGDSTFNASQLQCEPFFGNWDSIEIVHVYGDAVLPNSLYEVQMVGSDCVDTTDTTCHSSPLQIYTGQWCDVAPPYYTPFGSSQPDIADVLAIVSKWLGESEPRKAFAQLQPNVLNPGTNVGISDVLVAVDAWLGSPYPYPGPTSCQ